MFDIDNFDEFVLSLYTPQWYEEIKHDFSNYHDYSAATNTILTSGVHYTLAEYLMDVDYAIRDAELSYNPEPDDFVPYVERPDNRLHKHYCYYRFTDKYEKLLTNAKKVDDGMEFKIKLKTYVTSTLNKIKTDVATGNKTYLQPLIDQLELINRMQFRDVPSSTLLNLKQNISQKSIQEIFHILSTSKFHFKRALVNQILPNDLPDNVNLLYKICFANDSEVDSIQAKFWIYEKKTDFYLFLFSVEELVEIRNFKLFEHFIFLDEDAFKLKSYRKQKSIFKKTNTPPIPEIIALKEYM